MKHSFLSWALIMLVAIGATHNILVAQNCGYFNSPNTVGWNLTTDPCDTSLNRTDPYAPYDPLNPTRANTFNWIDPNPDPASFWDEFCLNSSTINATHIKTPFNQDNNSVINHFLDSQDKFPEDGWELIKYDLGYNASGQATGTGIDYPYLVLYNRFTGILRVFLALSETGAPFQVAQTRLEFIAGAGPMSSNLDLSTAFTNSQNGITSLKGFTGEFPRFVSASRYLSGPGKWIYADFPMMYDPCVCSYDSKMKISTFLINTAEVSGSSIGTGTITPDEDALSKSNDVYKDEEGILSWGWKNLSNVNDAAQKSAKAYKDMDSFKKGLEAAIDKSGLSFVDKEKKKGLIADFAVEIKLPNAFKSVLNAMPYVSAAISFLDFFVGGGKESSGPQEVVIQPMGIEMNTRYKGTITQTLPKQEITFNTPGGTNINPLNLDYPYYNEALGVFHLVETPVLYHTEFFSPAQYLEIDQSAMVDPFGHNPFKIRTGYNPGDADNQHVRLLRYRHQLKSAPEYLINPATQFTDESEIYGAFYVLSREGNNPAGIGHKAGFNFNLISEGKGIYRTPFVPLDCMEGMVLDFAMDFDTEVEVFFKVVANFNRGDRYVSSTTQNVLWQGNFAIETQQDVNLNLSTPFRNAFVDRTIDNTLSLNDGFGVYQRLTITNNAVLSAPNPITVSVGEELIVEPGAEISPNITFQIGSPNGCSNKYGPVDPTTLSTYCNSASYNSSDRVVRQPAPDILDSTVDDLRESKNQLVKVALSVSPNPVGDWVEVEYTLSSPGVPKIYLYDMMGGLVKVLQEGANESLGTHSHKFMIPDLASGLYNIVLDIHGRRETVKIIKL